MQVWREWTNLPDGAWLWAVRWQFERRNKDSFPFLLHRIAHFISYSPSFYFLLSPSIFFLSITLSFNYYSLTLVLDPIMMMVYLLVTQHMSWGVFTESHLHILRFLFSIITFNFFLSTSSSFNNYYTYSSTRSRSDHGDGVLASHPAHVIGSSQNRIFTSSGFYFLLSLSIFFLPTPSSFDNSLYLFFDAFSRSASSMWWGRTRAVIFPPLPFLFYSRHCACNRTFFPRMLLVPEY